MQEIPRYILNQIYEMIGEKTKGKMIKHLYDDLLEPDESFETYIKNLLSATFFVENDVVDFVEIKYTYHRRRQLNKKNWYKTLKQEVEANKITPIHQEVEVVENLLSRGHNTKDIFELFNVEKPQDLFQVRLDELEKWAYDKTTRLTDFPYLESKKRYQLEKAFETDIIYIISEYLKENPSNWITHRPKVLVEYPIFTDGHAVMKQPNLRVDPDTKRTVLYDQYKIQDDWLIESIIQPAEGDNVVLKKASLLDQKDAAIIQYALNQRDERFYTDKTILLELGGIVKAVYGSDGKKVYDLVKERLMKIFSYSVQGHVVNKNQKIYRNFAISFFQKVDIQEDYLNTGKTYVEIMFSDPLHEQFINKQTIGIYTDLNKKLKNPMSELLIYALQKERLEGYINETECRKLFDFNYFASKVRFRSKRIETNLKSIERCLHEFKEHEIFIEDYKRMGNGFEINFLPLSEYEKSDLFSSSSAKLVKG